MFREAALFSLFSKLRLLRQQTAKQRSPLSSALYDKPLTVFERKLRHYFELNTEHRSLCYVCQIYMNWVIVTAHLLLDKNEDFATKILVFQHVSHTLSILRSLRGGGVERSEAAGLLSISHTKLFIKQSLTF